MSTKVLENLWREYPRSSLHCDVTRAGLDSFQIIVSLIASDGEVIGSITHYGSGNLDQVKEQAYAELVAELKQHAEA